MTKYIASLSYGKDSLAMLETIKQLGWTLDRIVTAEVWATDTIQADLPPMVEFKKKADKIIKERYGIEVEHFRSKNSYEGCFYKPYIHTSLKAINNGLGGNGICGFASRTKNWCNSRLKMDALREAKKGIGKDYISYVGIAADEPIRIERHIKNSNVKMPLVEIGWDEAYCRKWCEEKDLLSPIYTNSARGGCWFCYNQGIDQLRKLRHDYPNYWKLLLKWDSDSPVPFKTDGHTVHDFDRRFQAEDDGFICKDKRFRWADLECF